jgi:hypothetical protein
VERCDHGEQGVGCEQGANYEGCEQTVSEPEPDCGAISWQKILPKSDAEIFSAKRCHGLIDLIQIVTGDEIRNQLADVFQAALHRDDKGRYGKSSPTRGPIFAMPAWKISGPPW